MSLNWGIVSAFAILFGSVKARKALNRLEEAPQRVPHQVPVPSEPRLPVPVQRRRVPHYPAPDLEIVTIHKACDLFIDWMNHQGKIGLWTSSEIDLYWRTACIDLDLEPFEPCFLREALAGRKLKVGQRRLNSPEYLHIKKRTSAVRPVLYRIPRCRAMSGAEPEHPATSPDVPAIARPRPGQRAALEPEPVQMRRFA